MRKRKRKGTMGGMAAGGAFFANVGAAIGKSRGGGEKPTQKQEKGLNAGDPRHGHKKQTLSISGGAKKKRTMVPGGKTHSIRRDADVRTTWRKSGD